MKIYNRYFRRNYEAIETYEAGIELQGDEVKSVLEGRIKLEGSYIKNIDNQVFLTKAVIYKYKYSSNKNYDEQRPRRLLLKKREIIRIKTKLQSSRGLTVIPLSCYNKGRYIKLEIALARGRTDIEKRKLDKKRKLQRIAEKELKEHLKNQ